MNIVKDVLYYVLWIYLLFLIGRLILSWIQVFSRSWHPTGVVLVIAEAIFNFPGMGLLFWQSALSHDFPVLLGATLIIGVATVLGNLLADVAYGILDPRIRHAVA